MIICLYYPSIISTYIHDRLSQTRQMASPKSKNVGKHLVHRFWPNGTMLLAQTYTNPTSDLYFYLIEYFAFIQNEKKWDKTNLKCNKSPEVFVVWRKKKSGNHDNILLRHPQLSDEQVFSYILGVYRLPIKKQKALCDSNKLKIKLSRLKKPFCQNSVKSITQSLRLWENSNKRNRIPDVIITGVIFCVL